MKENSIGDRIEEKYIRYLNCETDTLELTIEEAIFILETDESLHYVEDLLQEAYKVILSDYKRVLKENEEYSKQLDLDYVDKNYIPKQKIKAKIEELNKTINKGGIIYSIKQCARCQKDVLENLLIEESED